MASRQFYLMKLDVPPEIKKDKTQFSGTFDTLRAFGGRLQDSRTLTPTHTDHISISSTNREEKERAVETLKKNFILTNRYPEIARCNSIAAYGYRIYFDPYCVLPPEADAEFVAGMEDVL